MDKLNRDILVTIENLDASEFLDEISEQIVQFGWNVTDILEGHWKLPLDHLKDLFLEGASAERDSAYEVLKKRASSVYDWYFIYCESHNDWDIQCAKNTILSTQMSSSQALFFVQTQIFKEYAFQQIVWSETSTLRTYKSLLKICDSLDMFEICFENMLNISKEYNEKRYVLKKIYGYYEMKISENDINTVFNLVLYSSNIPEKIKKVVRSIFKDD